MTNDNDNTVERIQAAYRSPKKFSRRGMLGMLGASAAGVSGLGALTLLGKDGGPTASSDPAFGDDRPVRDYKPVSASGKAQRALVVIELAGGNDWLSTLVPSGDGALRTLRKDTLPDMEKLIAVAPGFSANANLASTARSIAFLNGVGTLNPTGSHFEMAERWYVGNSDGKKSLTTGFLGRLCDELDEGAPVTGVSLAGTTSAMLSRKSVTIGVPQGGGLEWLTSDEAWARNLRNGLEALGGEAKGDSPLASSARSGVTKALRFSAILDGLKEERKGYPGGGLSEQLMVASKILTAKAGVRVLHLTVGGFDTHAGQRYQHDELMKQIDLSVAAFINDLNAHGLAGTTLIATISEFGRRPKENAGGTDHGTAGGALLWGPVKAGMHGSPLSLRDLDQYDNFKATVMMDEYYATLAESWLGVDAASVLSAKVKPIAGLINE